MESDEELSTDGSLKQSSALAPVKRMREEPTMTATSKKMHPVIMQQLMQPRCKSSVWIYFERLDMALARCRICNQNYRFGSSISNLRHHAETKHMHIMKAGPAKFLESLKVPKEQVDKLVSTTRKWDRRTNFKRYDSKERAIESIIVKEEPTITTEITASSIDDEDIAETLESIYDKSDETINGYMQSPDVPHVQLDSSNNDFTLENDEESEMYEFTQANPLHGSISRSTGKFLRLKEERMEAETNYFNKKASYLERSTELVEVQKRHVMMQMHKLKLEIAAMREGLFHS